MIIECINCNKKFNVDSDLIPSTGRTVQCGSCNHVWLFDKKNTENTVKNKIEKKSRITPKSNKAKNFEQKSKKTNIDIRSSKKSQIIKYEPKTSFTISKFLSYLLVIIISFISLLILIDTFKSPLFYYFPKLEFILFNFYETLKDIELFIKDLI